MKTIHNYDDSWVAEIFDNLHEFCNKCDTRKVNRVFSRKSSDISQLSSHKISAHHTEFTGSTSFDECQSLMRGGYTEGVRSIKMAKPKVTEYRNDFRMEASVVGHTPHIPHFIMGHPLTMIRTIRPVKPAQEMVIYYDRSENCNISADKITRSSRTLLDAIAHLERIGVRITLYVGDVAYSGGSQKSACLIRVKEAMASVNIAKLSYILVHPSFLRRHIFAWYETSPVITDPEFSVGYGQAYSSYDSSIERRRQALIDNRIIGKRWAYIDGATLRRYDDASKVIEFLSKQTSTALA